MIALFPIHRLRSEHRCLLATASLLVGLTVPESVSAQQATDDECRQAVRFLESTAAAAVNAPPGLTENRYRASVTLLTCGAQGGQVAASMIRASRYETDSVALVQNVTIFRVYRDTAVAMAALDVAGDRGASVEARVAALRVLWLLSTGEYWIEASQMLPNPDSTPLRPLGKCGSGYEMSDSTPFWYEGSGLPADFRERRKALAYRILSDATEPYLVRAAASCAIRR